MDNLGVATASAGPTKQKVALYDGFTSIAKQPGKLML